MMGPHTTSDIWFGAQQGHASALNHLGQAWLGFRSGKSAEARLYFDASPPPCAGIGQVDTLGVTTPPRDHQRASLDLWDAR